MPLGHWIHLPTNWKWFQSVSLDYVYEKVEQGWKTYRLAISRINTRRRLYVFATMVQSIPTPSLPTTTFRVGHRIATTGTALVANIQKREQRRWWDNPVFLPNDINDLINGIYNHTAVCVMDGSAKNDLATAAFCLSPSVQRSNNNII